MCLAAQIFEGLAPHEKPVGTAILAMQLLKEI
jgi:hypothetical protein